MVANLSEANDNAYQLLARPWVKLWTTELSAEILRWLHPLRTQRYLFADINPLMRPVKNIASIVRSHRKPASPDNPFPALERDVSAYMEGALDIYRDWRDRNQENLFQLIYGSDWLRRFFPPPEPAASAEMSDAERADYDRRLLAMEEGGLAAGLIRVYMAIAKLGQQVKRKHFETGEEIARTHRVLKKLRPAEFKKIMHEQTAILQADEDKAIGALAVLIKDKGDREEALSIARRLCLVDGVYNDAEKVMLEKIRKGLGL